MKHRYRFCVYIPLCKYEEVQYYNNTFIIKQKPSMNYV